MDLGDLQRRGDVLQLLALLTGDPVVGQQHEIGHSDDLLLGGLVEPPCRRAELGDGVAFGVGLGGACHLIRRQRSARLVLIDLLDEAGLALISPPSDAATATMALRIQSAPLFAGLSTFCSCDFRSMPPIVLGSRGFAKRP